MAESILYKGQNIVLDVIIKAEHVITLISEQTGVEFDDAYQDFVTSDTYAALMNTSTLMWAESAEFICDEYQREMRRQNS